MAQYSGWQSPGYSNPNLLVNGNFRNPVNRRGQSSYTGAGYTIDTWWLQSLTGLNLNSGYITVSGLYDFRQTLETALDAGLYTISAKYKGAKGNMVLRVSDGQNVGMWDLVFDTTKNGLITTTFNVPRKIKYVAVFGNGDETSKIDLYAVKLESGTVSTLQADILNPIPYEYELSRCLQYDLDGHYMGAVAASNPNLLINWDFRQPINQRGQSSYILGATRYDYCLDMCNGGNLTATIKDGCVNLKSDSNAKYKRFSIRREPLKQGVYTISAKIKVNAKHGDVGLYYSEDLIAASGKAAIIPDAGFDGIIQFTFETQEKQISWCGVELIASNTTDAHFDIDVYAVKLEVGTVSTLALDLMQPSNYAEQLRKCQRYFYTANTIGNGYSYFGSGTSYAWETQYVPIAVALPYNMRIFPTVSKVGDLKLTDVISRAILTVTGVAVERSAINGMIELKVMAEGIVGGHQFVLTTVNDITARLFFSAEL